MTERDWKVAEDLPGRLVELREALGDSIPEFTRRFCRTRKQWYQWKEGTQLPGPTLLETAAENYDWPLEIFTEGGRRPKELVNSLVKSSELGEPSGVPQTQRPPTTTATELDRAILDLDRVRTTLAQFRATLGVRSGPGETEPGAAALPSAADTIRDAAMVPGTPSLPPGQAQEGNG